MNKNPKFINALINNDIAITSEIYERFYPKVASFVLKNNGNTDDAKDVFQEALIYILYSVKEKSLKIDSFEAYLFTICKNIWRRTLKNKKEWVMNEKHLLLIDETTDRSKLILDLQKHELYNDNYAKLSENCKAVLSLYFNTFNYDDLLKEFSYSTIDAARQRVYKCKKKLLEKIKTDKRYNFLNR